MSKVNRYQPFLVVLAEDGACRDVWNGIAESLPTNLSNQSSTLPLKRTRGWQETVAELKRILSNRDGKLSQALFVVIIDFDGHLDSRKADIQRELENAGRSDDVFIFGFWDEPEAFRKEIAHKYSLRKLGAILGSDCESEYWQHSHISHNLNERDRLRKTILFESQ